MRDNARDVHRGRDPDRLYVGTIVAGTHHIGLTEWGHHKALSARHDVRNHSPDGFAWGYEGSGPAQAALAILCDVIGSKRAVDRGLYQQFKRDVIAAFDQRDGWSMTARTVEAWVRDNEATDE